MTKETLIIGAVTLIAVTLGVVAGAQINNAIANRKK